ncbi:uncharacterized protein LOC143038326 [Oratosquilla oratoria]|uniref:uncharacterized protein LOC143038326 n=1 Tax=Oratosquilla oratoria TaxID=337810 RepID=UPI003F7631DB
MAEVTFAVLLLYGTLKNSPTMLFAWVVWNIVAICLLFLVSGLVIVLATSSSSILSHMLYTPVVLFPRVLALVVVFSHYRRLKSDGVSNVEQPEQ